MIMVVILIENNKICKMKKFKDRIIHFIIVQNYITIYC